MKPLIGITADIDRETKFILNKNYVKAIIQAGGLPVILPSGIEQDVKQLCKTLDGLLLTGGVDIDPTFFGEEPHMNLGEVSPSRDVMELAIIKEMSHLNKPILGICRGLQLINIAFGGNIYQDIPSQHTKPVLQHSQKAPRNHQSHYVKVEEGTVLRSITGKDQVKVNSFHHQAAKNVPKPLLISGVANDGIIEAIESTEHNFLVAVQWHPEELAEKGEASALRLFKEFIKECIESRTSL